MNKTKGKINVFLLILALIIVFLSFSFEFIKNNAIIIEKLFPQKSILYLKSVVFSVISLFDFSVAEIFICIFLSLIILIIIFFIANIIKTSQKLAFVINFISKGIIITGIFYIIFMLFCGIDYYRVPLEQKINLKTDNITNEQTLVACDIILQKLNMASKNVRRDSGGLFISSMNNKQKFDYSVIAYKNLIRSKIIEDISFSKPKPIFFSEALNYFYISGFYFPFTGEANINIKEDNIYLPFVICHEKAHQYGIMREQEANYAAFLACVESTNDEFVYSGYLKAFMSVLTKIKVQNINKYNELILQLDENIIGDISRYNKNIIKYQGKLSDISQSANNLYLIFQGQSDGIKSYDKMADLVIAGHGN